MSTAEAQVSFNIKQPFRTRCGWPARLVGVLQRRSNPYVVAVWNPNYKAEELHCYPETGDHQTESHNAHPLDLVEIPEDDYWAWAAPESKKDTIPLHAYVIKEPSWPVNRNVAHLDHSSLITPLVNGWTALTYGTDREDEHRPLTQMKFYNHRTGDVFSLRFSPMDQREIEHAKA